MNTDNPQAIREEVARRIELRTRLAMQLGISPDQLELVEALSKDPSKISRKSIPHRPLHFKRPKIARAHRRRHA